MQCQIHEIPEGDLLLGDLQSRNNRRGGERVLLEKALWKQLLLLHLLFLLCKEDAKGERKGVR